MREKRQQILPTLQEKRGGFFSDDGKANPSLDPIAGRAKLRVVFVGRRRKADCRKSKALQTDFLSTP